MKIFIWWVLKVKNNLKKRVKWGFTKSAICADERICNRCDEKTTVDKKQTAMLSYEKDRKKSR